MLQNLKSLVAGRPWLHKAYLAAKRVAGGQRLPPPGAALFGLLNDSQNPEAIAAFDSYRTAIERILPKLKPAPLEEAINSVGFLTAINPAQKDLSTAKPIWGDGMGAFFAGMVSNKPYDLKPDYLFAMMDRAEAMGEAYALPAYAYLFSVFQIYSEPGEADRHAQFMEQALRWFESKPITQERLALFARTYSGSFPTSNRKNLKSILEIERRLLRRHNDFLFPGLAHDLPVPKRAAKIKLGLLRYNGRGEINFFRPLLNGLPQDKYEIHILVFDQDGVQDLRAAYPSLHYHMMGMQLDEAVKAARAIGMDILINSSSLSGDFLNPVAALLNYRLAPIQISYIADIATAGIPELDYFLIGEKIGAADLQGELVERVLTGPGVGFFIPPPVLGPQDPDAKRRERGIAPADIVFATNAHMLKLTPDLLAVWIEILAQTENTKLLLMPFSSDLVTGRFGRAFLAMLWDLCESRDVARDRIVLSHARGRAETLADLQAGDIYLDTFPYSGATSGAEALMAGLPIVTCTGAAMRARYLAAMLDEIGLGDSVAKDIKGYADLAVRLARTPKLRQEIAGRTGRAVTTASFFDAALIADQLDLVLSDLMKEKTRTLKTHAV